MKSIRVYGDSFLSDTVGFDGPCWLSILAEKLNLSIVNNAVAGGSTEYAFIKFCKDVENSVIKNDDIIFFNTSNSGRLNLKFQHDGRPETAALYYKAPSFLHRWIGSDVDQNHDWYYNNKKHIEWYIVNQDYDLLELNKQAYTRTLKDYAKSNPASTVIVLHNNLPEFSTPFDDSPKNFLHPNISLWQISKNEFSSNINSYLNWVKYTNQDSRLNHLTVPNLKIMADLMYTSIKNLDSSIITYDKFNKNFLETITNHKEYFKYVDDGLLYYHNDTVTRID